MSLEIRITSDRTAFGDLRDDWNDLARRSRVDHAFMRHEWFCNWWDHLPHGGEMRVLTGRRDGRLVAAAPLYVRRETRRGLPVRMLSFMQSGISPRLNFLVDREQDPAEVFAALEGIPGWDLAELKGLERDHPQTALFLDWLGARGGCVVEDGAASPYHEMPADWKTFERSRTKSNRKRFRNAMNRCRAADGFRVDRIETFADFDARFDDFLAVSGRSWKAAGGSDLVTQRGMAGFFRGLARDTDGQGLWVLYLLYLEGKPVAIGFAVRHERRLVALRWDFDDGYRYYMPGVVIHVHVIRDMMEAWGGGEYDLSGTETEFKSGLVDGVRRHIDVTFGRNGLRSRVLMGLKRGLRSLRGSRP